MELNLTQKRRERYQNAFVLFCCLIVSLFLQIFKFQIFPEKYFFDAETVQSYMRMSIAFNPGSTYYNTALFFKWLDNWFPMDAQLEGGLILWTLMILPTGWVVARYMRATWEHYLLVAAYAVMLPVFVWNTHKEVLQYLFFLLIAAVAFSIKRENLIADVTVVSLLLLWSSVFRVYYLIIATGAAFFMVADRLPWDEIKPETKKKIILSLICVVLLVLLFMSIFLPQAVTELFSGRYVNEGRENDPNANTIINDLIENPGQKLSIYLLNYGIAAVRMMLPLELLFKGAQYLPFMVFQIFWTVLLGMAIKRLLQGKWHGVVEKRLLFVAISWYLVAFLFEPDFGSFVRHQVAGFPLFYPVFSFVLHTCGSDDL